MRKLLIGLTLAALAVPSSAALPVGAKAPDFTTTGARAGKPFKLNLNEQLRNGPVVLYFFPKAFTEGCTLEARAFSEANAEFRKAGARVIGMSADDLSTLQKFSVEECRNAFPVATANPAIIRAYDVALKQKPELTSRTSYVIARDGRVAFVHSDMNWSEHVQRTLAAVKALK
ncbi:MAG: peroxiredoxin [Pseudomonadota bacterium]|jgi:peroxiredoxin|nr:peroxiredoxin [Sphingomonas sp.]MDQ3483608.1 peroxiredoxin [Pseudomonadota bacterium]